MLRRSSTSLATRLIVRHQGGLREEGVLKSADRVVHRREHGRRRGLSHQRARKRASQELESTTPGRARVNSNDARYRGKSARALGESLKKRGLGVVVEEIIAANHEELISLVGLKCSCELRGRVPSAFCRHRQPIVARETNGRDSGRPTRSVTLSERRCWICC